MARSLRIEFPGGCYHVINRGNYRQRIFQKKGAADAFERTLGEASERFGWRVHAYVVMGNHFHIAVELAEPNLSEGMKWLQGTWIRRFNEFRNWTGRPFQGRYKAILVEPGRALGRVCHYIHLNPVRAGIVEASDAGEYRWSSLRHFPLSDRPVWLEPTTVLREGGRLPDTCGGWKRYRAYLEFLATDDLARKELVASRMSRGWCIGEDAFVDSMREAARQKKLFVDGERFAGLEREELLAEREAHWESLLQRAADLAGVDLNALPEQKMAPQKCLLAAVLKRVTSVSNGWLAKRLQMGQAATASQGARRWQKSAQGLQESEKLLKQLTDALG